MALTLATPIATARTILNDPDAVRYSAADLLQYANDALDQMVGLAPQLFYTVGTHTCAINTTEQSLSTTTALALVSVDSLSTGVAVAAADRAELDAFVPGWRAATGAAAVNWMPVEGHPRRFLIYPKAPATEQILNVTYVAVPGEYAVGADTGLPMIFGDAIADYIVARAESRDAEHVLSGRAAQFMGSFQAKVAGPAQ